MSIHRLENDHTTLWGIWKIEEDVETLFSLLPQPEKYRQESEQLHSSARLTEWLAVRVLLFRMTGRNKTICYHSSGKPYLADGSFYISISHTKGYVAVTLNPSQEVTVDIEYYSERIKKISSRFINPFTEHPSYYCGDTTWSLLLHWCAKEAMFKYLDEQEIDFRKHLWVQPFQVEMKGEFTAQEFRTEEKRTFRIAYLLAPDYTLVLCRSL